MRAMGVMSWPPSHAPPPGATLASTMVILSSGRALARWYAHERPALPAPTMTTSDTARSYSVAEYLRRRQRWRDPCAERAIVRGRGVGAALTA